MSLFLLVGVEEKLRTISGVVRTISSVFYIPSSEISETALLFEGSPA
jgi:hypothetical protein